MSTSIESRNSMVHRSGDALDRIIYCFLFSVWSGLLPLPLLTSWSHDDDSPREGERPVEGPAHYKKIEEYKVFLRGFQQTMGPEWFARVGGIATIDRQLIMIDALLLATCTSTSAVKNFLPPGRANHSGVVSKRKGVGSSIETVARGRRRRNYTVQSMQTCSAWRYISYR